MKKVFKLKLHGNTCLAAPTYFLDCREERELYKLYFSDPKFEGNLYFVRENEPLEIEVYCASVESVLDEKFINEIISSDKNTIKNKWQNLKKIFETITLSKYSYKKDLACNFLKSTAYYPHYSNRNFDEPLFYNGLDYTEESFLFLKALQVIKFGPPGTGKSHSVVETIRNHCGENKYRGHADVITTVFHPDYSYGDFTAKLVPVTFENDGKKAVEYQIHAGPLTKALARALANPCDNVYLVIEEINRGNTAAIFGDIFQLLDRDECGESEYPIHIQKLFYEALEQEFLIQMKLRSANSDSFDESNAKDKLAKILKNQQLVLPSNLSIIATMNTSDESVFYMDSAFKRRWHFEYIDVDLDSSVYEAAEDKKENHPLHPQITAKVDGLENCQWDCFRKNINNFIKLNKNSIRRIEDKLIGLWFIKAQNGEISESEIKNKLMHYLWDNVFARDKQPLIDKVNGQDIVTFGDFIRQYEAFIKAFCEGCPEKAAEES